MLNSMVIATRAIIELAATQDRSIGEVQPEILCKVALLTCPSRGGNLLSIIQLKQVLSMSENKVITILKQLTTLLNF
jgi:hypothetical protein